MTDTKRLALALLEDKKILTVWRRTSQRPNASHFLIFASGFWLWPTISTSPFSIKWTPLGSMRLLWLPSNSRFLMRPMMTLNSRSSPCSRPFTNLKSFSIYEFSWLISSWLLRPLDPLYYFYMDALSSVAQFMTLSMLWSESAHFKMSLNVSFCSWLCDLNWCSIFNVMFSIDCKSFFRELCSNLAWESLLLILSICFWARNLYSRGFYLKKFSSSSSWKYSFDANLRSFDLFLSLLTSENS